MPSIINAGTTTATALNITTDTTGSLEIQTSDVNAISISNGQIVTLANPLPANSGGTGITSLGSGVATFLGTPTSSNLAAAVTDETGTGSLVFSISPALTGTPIAPTAANGTNTTQIATTAFVNAAVTIATGSLGTISTQNANNVNITGGSITGITDLTVADGGTGRSSLTANNIILGNGASAVNFVAPGTLGNILVSNGTTWSSSNVASSGAKLGLSITGEVWNNVTGSRSFNTNYTNSFTYPILVSASTNYMGGSQQLLGYVNGALVCFWKWQFNGAGAVGGVVMIVPPGATYSCNTDGGTAVQNWVELY